MQALRESWSNARVKNGPCERSVEPVLQKNGIQRQSYHGCAFVGNHIHKALSQKVIGELTAAPKDVIAQRCPPLADEVDEVATRYSTLMTQYASCSSLFSTSSAVTTEQLATLDANIKVFMASARREIVARRLGNITPKLHLLEDHVVKCMRRFGVGLGLLGEQGGEGIHHEFNVLSATFLGIRQDLKRLKTVVHQHCVSTLPQHRLHLPTPATRPGRRKPE